MEEEDTVQRSLQQELAHLKETLHELNSELCLESDSSGKSEYCHLAFNTFMPRHVITF